MITSCRVVQIIMQNSVWLSVYYKVFRLCQMLFNNVQVLTLSKVVLLVA